MYIDALNSDEMDWDLNSSRENVGLLGDKKVFHLQDCDLGPNMVKVIHEANKSAENRPHISEAGMSILREVREVDISYKHTQRDGRSNEYRARVEFKDGESKQDNAEYVTPKYYDRSPPDTSKNSKNKE